MQYGVLTEVSGTKVSIARGHVDAGGVVPPHAGDIYYALYILNGSGRLTLNKPSGEETESLEFAPNDLIVFPPHSHHGWINGDKPFDWLSVDIAS